MIAFHIDNRSGRVSKAWMRPRSPFPWRLNTHWAALCSQVEIVTAAGW